MDLRFTGSLGPERLGKGSGGENRQVGRSWGVSRGRKRTFPWTVVSVVGFPLSKQRSERIANPDQVRSSAYLLPLRDDPMNA